MDGPDRLRLLERAVTASTNSIVISDPNQPDYPLVYVNPAFERTTGYASEEVLGRNCRFLQDEDRDQPALGELRTAVREGRHCTVVLRNYRKDGTLFWNELSIYPVRDEEGRMTSFVGVQNDITERIRADEILSEIRRAERRRIARDLHDIVLQDLSGALQSLRHPPAGQEIRDKSRFRRGTRGPRAGELGSAQRHLRPEAREGAAVPGVGRIVGGAEPAGHTRARDTIGRRGRVRCRSLRKGERRVVARTAGGPHKRKASLRSEECRGGVADGRRSDSDRGRRRWSGLRSRVG